MSTLAQADPGSLPAEFNGHRVVRVFFSSSQFRLAGENISEASFLGSASWLFGMRTHAFCALFPVSVRCLSFHLVIYPQCLAYHQGEYFLSGFHHPGVPWSGRTLLSGCARLSREFPVSTHFLPERVKMGPLILVFHQTEDAHAWGRQRGGLWV